MSADKKRPGLGIKMTSYDELCGGDIGLDNSVEINIEELHDFPDHPFSSSVSFFIRLEQENYISLEFIPVC